MKRAVPLALSPAHSVNAPTYHSAGPHGQFIAHFPDGTRVPIELSRQRAYPGIESAAPQTSNLYCTASEWLDGSQAIWDVGTGSGYGCHILAGSARRVWGFDSDAAALEFASRLVPRVRFGRLPGEHHHLPEPDAMVLVDVLSVTEEPRALLWHLRRLAPPGCRLFLAEERVRTSSGTRAFDEQSLRRLLLLSGWRLLTGEHPDKAFVAGTAECGDRGLGAHYQAAQRSLEREAFDEAVRYLKQLTQSDYDPTVTKEAWLLLAHLALLRGDVEAMQHAWSSALDTRSQLPDVPREVRVGGSSISRRQDDRSAARATQLASALHPADPLTWTRLASTFALPQHHAAAEAAWRTLRAHPATPSSDTFA